MNVQFQYTAKAKRKILLNSETRHIPKIVRTLNEWQYLERTLHRMMAHWGRQHQELIDKAALHRHVWDQAEIIRRLRGRVEQFPGGKADAPVHPEFEKLATVAFKAPTFDDALDGIYHLLLKALVGAYVHHVQEAHPSHDAPTISLLHEINTIKEQQFFWYREYRRAHPHQTDRRYREALEKSITQLNAFQDPMPDFKTPGAALPGIRDSLPPPQLPGFPKKWRPAYDIMPYLSVDFEQSAEARRLFWAIAYLRECSLPDDQLLWITYGDYMPWEWHHDISRHLWDESRHSLSGYSRLLDWGISLDEVGHLWGDSTTLRHSEAIPLQQRLIDPFLSVEEMNLAAPSKPMSPADLYESVFVVGLVAESGHFTVKNESYQDFRSGADFESAEMMLFDIIDETAHVQYAHRWIPTLAAHAGIDSSNYQKRGVQIRNQRQAAQLKKDQEAASLPRTSDFAPWNHYQNLLARINQTSPFSNNFKPEKRSPRPM